MFLKITIFIALALFAQAKPGDLDPTFGTVGKLSVGAGTDYGNAVALQPDGRLIVAGQSSDPWQRSFSLVRYTTNGAPDPTFGTSGKVRTFVGYSSGANAVTVLPDGKILAAGVSGDYDFALIRYLSNGTPDTSFGNGGIVTTGFYDSDDAAVAIAVQTDGKIVLVGRSNSRYCAIVRYNANGSLDTTFGDRGKVATPIRQLLVYPNAVVLLNGKIYVSGNTSELGGYDQIGFISCYDSNGSLNAGFGANGTVSLTSGSTVSSMAVLAGPTGEEKIIVAGQVTISERTVTTYQALWSYDANTGSVDTTFGSNGSGSTRLNIAGTTGSGVKILNLAGTPNRIVVAGNLLPVGSTNKDFLITRYELNGTLDTTFDGDGIAFTDIDGGDDARAMQIQPHDNKIVLVGSSYKITQLGTESFSSDNDFAVVRFNPDGSLDPTFSGDGKQLVDIGNAAADPRATIVQPDGKIITACTTAIVRLNVDGTMDTTFDGDGKSKIPAGYINAGSLQQDGKLVLTAFGNGGGLVVYRLKVDGTLDNTFDGDGMAIPNIGPYYTIFKALAIQTDGAIVLAGYANGGSSQSDFAVARLLSNGKLDTSFDFDGKTTTPIFSGADQANAIVLQPDGKIVVAGYSHNQSNNDFAIVRYNADGSLDLTFDQDGKLTTSFPAGNDVIEGLFIDDGKLVATGFSTDGVDRYLALAKYNLSDGSLDTTFSSDGQATVALEIAQNSSSYRLKVALQPDGKFLVSGVTLRDANPRVCVNRLTPDGLIDPSFGTNGSMTLANFKDLNPIIATDSLGRVVIAGSSDSFLVLARIQGDPLLTITPTFRSTTKVSLDGFGVPGKTHQIETSTTLNSFTTLANVTPDAAGKWHYEENFNATARKFYRLKLP